MAATVLKYRGFAGYSKGALADARLKTNLKALHDALADSKESSGFDLDGSSEAGLKPEFDRIDPISRQLLRRELEDIYDASTNKNEGTTDL